MSFPILFPQSIEELHRQPPNGISGLTAWYRSDDVVLSTNQVLQWTDRSGNGYHLTPPDIAHRPTYVVSDPLLKHPVLVGDGVNDVLRTSFITQLAGVPAITVFAVQYKLFTSTSTKIIYNFMGSTGTTINNLGASLFYNASNGLSFNMARFPSPGVFATDTLATTTNVPYILSNVWNRAGATHAARFVVYKNGALQTTVAGTDNPMTGSPAFISLPLEVFGRFTAGSLSGATRFAELIVYNRVLTTEERQSVEHYLGARYSIAVP